MSAGLRLGQALRTGTEGPPERSTIKQMNGPPIPLRDYLRDGIAEDAQGERKTSRWRRRETPGNYRRMGCITASSSRSIHIGPIPTKRFGDDEYVYFTVSTGNWDERGKVLILQPTGGMYAFPAHNTHPATQVQLDRPPRHLYRITPSSPPFLLDRTAAELIDALAGDFFHNQPPHPNALEAYVRHVEQLPQPIRSLLCYAAPDFTTWCGLSEADS